MVKGGVAFLPREGSQSDVRMDPWRGGHFQLAPQGGKAMGRLEAHQDVNVVRHAADAFASGPFDIVTRAERAGPSPQPKNLRRLARLSVAMITGVGE